jgi:hypothetical protein
VGSTAVLVHNEHEKVLGWIKKKFAKIDEAIKALPPDVAAKVARYIGEYQKNPIFETFLESLNNPANKQKLDEVLDIIGRTGRYLPFEIDEIIKKLKKSDVEYVLDGTGPYSVIVNGVQPVNGHHPIMKAAFQNDKNYNYKKAFCVSKEAIGGQTVHDAISANQRRLYDEAYHRLQAMGKQLTIDDVIDIEIRAMVEAGKREAVARGWVIKALEDLKLQNTEGITNFPWHGSNL